MVWTWFAAIGGVSFIVASGFVSVRLLLLARRTREMPEFLLGTGLLLSGAIGYPVNTIARTVPPSALQSVLFAASGLLAFASLIAMSIFTWRVFRPADAWARALCVGGIGITTCAFLWQTAGPGWAAFCKSERGPWSISEVTQLATLFWAGTESLLYHRKLVKRMQLGLGDPITANRLLLWAISEYSAFVISGTVSLLRVAGVPMTNELIGIVIGPLGVTLAVAVWLAFLPPSRYTRWIAVRAQREA
jgi:hypothetical protein